MQRELAMLFSKRSLEGWLLRDNRNSGGTKEEQPTIICSHCHVVVILNPKRTRARNYCTQCDHYICDVCAEIRSQSLECKALWPKLYELKNEMEKTNG